MRWLTIFVAGVVALGVISCGSGSGDDAQDDRPTATTGAPGRGASQTVSALLDGSTTIELQVTSEWSTALIPSGLVVAERAADLDPDDPPSGPRLLVGATGDPVDEVLALFPWGISEDDAAARLDVLDGPSEVRAGAGDYAALSITTREVSGAADTTRRYLTIYHDSVAHLVVLEAPSTDWEAAIERLDALVAESLRFVVSSAGGSGSNPAPTATSGPLARPAEVPVGWSLDLSDSFDRNVFWFDGTRDDEGPTTHAEVADGVYRLTVEGETNLAGRELVAVAVEPVLAVSTQAERTSEEAFCGLTLNYQSGWRVDFVVNMVSQRFGATAAQDDRLVLLVPGASHSGIRLDEPNRFTVIAEDDRIRLLVNGELVGDTTNERLGPVANVGVLAGNGPNGGSGTCEFDDFAIYVP